MGLSSLSWDQFKEHLDKEEASRPHWDIDVIHSSHEEMKQGRTDARLSRVILSKEHHPDPLEAEQTAALMGIARGEYVTGVGHRI